MEKIELAAERREVIGKKVKRIRAEGQVPAIIYGPEIEPIPIQVDEIDLVRTLREAGANRLITVNIGGDEDPHVTLARDVQRDVLARNLLHVDFQEVVLTETITSDVPLILKGTPSIVERGEALVNQMLDSVEIEALPTDLIPSIAVDISELEEVDDAILVSDLELSDRVTILTDPNEMIVRISHPEMDVEELEEAIIEEELEVEVIPEGEELEELEVDEEGLAEEEGEAEEEVRDYMM